MRATHLQDVHASPILRVPPGPLFFNVSYVQSLIPKAVHRTQRYEFGTHFFGGQGGIQIPVRS